MHDEIVESSLDGVYSYYLDDVSFMGLSFNEWTIRWWKWLLAIPKKQNPVLGKAPGDLYLKDRDTLVTFLVGTLTGKAQRTHFIHSNKPLLFPVINFITSYVEEPQLKTDFDLVLSARSHMDNIQKNVASIKVNDWSQLKGCRLTTSVFDINFPKENALDLPPGPTRAISDGYWIFLRPLPPGCYIIKALGSCSSGRTVVDITWDLISLPESEK